MSGSLEASSESLGQITKGLNAAIGELKELGGLGESNAGRGFAAIELTGMDTGHDGLTSAFKSFCERWEWGVRTLIQDGNEFAHRVHLSAGMYYEQDKYLEGTFKVVVAGFGSDPTLTDEQVEKMSMKEIADHGNFANVDYSGKSFEKSFDHIAETDKAVAKDWAETHAPASTAARRLRDAQQQRGAGAHE